MIPYYLVLLLPFDETGLAGTGEEAVVVDHTCGHVTVRPAYKGKACTHPAHTATISLHPAYGGKAALHECQ